MIAGDTTCRNDIFVVSLRRQTLYRLFGTDFVAQTIQKERNYIMDENKTTTQQTTADKPKRVSKFWEACQKYKDDWIIYDPTILDRI